MRRMTIVLGCSLLALAACQEKDQSAAPEVAAPGASVEVPTVADFEEEAEKEISPDNYQAELDKLEAEIGK